MTKKSKTILVISVVLLSIGFIYNFLVGLKYNQGTAEHQDGSQDQSREQSSFLGKQTEEKFKAELEPTAPAAQTQNKPDSVEQKNENTWFEKIRQTFTSQDQEPQQYTLDDLPAKVLNKAPFIPQAPYKVWDDLHDEACEEAAIITAHFYLEQKDKVSKEVAEKEIQALVRYQIKKMGSHRDINAQEMVELARDFYQEQYSLVDDYELDQIKLWLANQGIIIVPAAGRVLENPYFKQPGPLYHALVIIGYDDKKQEFITNDPGTKRGKEFRYDYDNLLNSVHDFPGDKEKILQGRKVLILVPKP
ncbi:MAG: hypothetical protein GF332_01155 [Candidatus Moranbacteria bacterium]|nr:hypothetical protein [Candidatus Moranbacteria bacterium]